MKKKIEIKKQVNNIKDKMMAIDIDNKESTRVPDKEKKVMN